MIPVPESIRAELASKFGAAPAALDHFGGGAGSSDGIVYAYPCGGDRRLLKILAAPWTERRRFRLALDERLRFMRYLGENGASVVYPRRSTRGELYETAAGAEHLWIAYAMDMARGTAKSEHAWDPRFFRNWGRAVGQLHRLTLDYPSWRAAIDPESGESFLTWEEEWQGFLDWSPDEDVSRQWLALKLELDELPIERDSFGFIHNDPHIWNLRVDGDAITLLDFDVANHHWFMTDIAIACQSILIFHSGGLNGPLHHPDRLRAFLRAFYDGYKREYELSDAWLDRLDLFIAYRRILMYIAMQDWVASQAELQARWKQLILSRPQVAGSGAFG